MKISVDNQKNMLYINRSDDAEVAQRRLRYLAKVVYRGFESLLPLIVFIYECGSSSMVEPLASTQKTRVRFPLTAHSSNFIKFEKINRGWKILLLNVENVL